MDTDELLARTLGLPLPAVTAVTSVVRTDVAAAVRRLLPGAPVRQGLVLAAARLAGEAPRLAMTARPGLSPGHAVAAALPAMLVHVLAAADAAGSEPSGELRAAYRARGQEIALTDPSGEIRTLAVAVADPLTTERTGTGWALLATAIGLDEHADKLPVPGRPRRRPKAKEAGAAEAGFAYQFGRRLTAGTALALLET